MLNHLISNDSQLFLEFDLFVYVLSLNEKLLRKINIFFNPIIEFDCEQVAHLVEPQNLAQEPQHISRIAFGSVSFDENLSVQVTIRLLADFILHRSDFISNSHTEIKFHKLTFISQPLISFLVLTQVIKLI